MRYILLNKFSRGLLALLCHKVAPPLIYSHTINSISLLHEKNNHYSYKN